MMGSKNGVKMKNNIKRSFAHKTLYRELGLCLLYRCSTNKNFPIKFTMRFQRNLKAFSCADLDIVYTHTHKVIYCLLSENHFK